MKYILSCLHVLTRFEAPSFPSPRSTSLVAVAPPSAPSTSRPSTSSAHDNMPAMSHPLDDGDCCVLAVDIDNLLFTPLFSSHHHSLFFTLQLIAALVILAPLESCSVLLTFSSYLLLPGNCRLTTVVRYPTRFERRHNAFHRSRLQHQRP